MRLNIVVCLLIATTVSAQSCTENSFCRYIAPNSPYVVVSNVEPDVLYFDNYQQLPNLTVAYFCSSNPSSLLSKSGTELPLKYLPLASNSNTFSTCPPAEFYLVAYFLNGVSHPSLSSPECSDVQVCCSYSDERHLVSCYNTYFGENAAPYLMATSTAVQAVIRCVSYQPNVPSTNLFEFAVKVGPVPTPGTTSPAPYLVTVPEQCDYRFPLIYISETPM